MNNKKLALIVLAASLAIAVLCLSRTAAAEPARGTGAFHSPNLINPHPSEDDDTGDDSGDNSGDATPIPEPQPATLAS